MTDTAVEVPKQLLTADAIEIADLYDEELIPAEATNAVDAMRLTADPEALSYIVSRTNTDGEAVEVLTVGLAQHFKAWALEKQPTELAYFLAMHKVTQLQHGVQVRLASKEDVEQRAGEREVAEAVTAHLNWTNDEEKRRSANAAVITRAFNDMGSSQTAVGAFLDQHNLDTAQIKAVAVRALKATPPVVLDKKTITSWAELVASKYGNPKPGKPNKTVAELEASFYQGSTKKKKTAE